MTESPAVDVARAARLAAAVSANDPDSIAAVFREAKNANRLTEMALALAQRHVQICSEFYDTDRQTMLDMYALDAMNYAEPSE